MNYNILIAGVGGQGNLLLGRILAEAALKEGLYPVIGETFGASRRGGTVYTHIRISSADIGPLIPKGHLDLLVGLEPLETLRAAIRYADRKTQTIVSLEPVHTLDSLADEKMYPDISKILESLNRICKSVRSFDTKAILEQIGSSKVLNTFFLGVITELHLTPISAKAIVTKLDDLIGFKGRNKEAYTAGMDASSS